MSISSSGPSNDAGPRPVSGGSRWPVPLLAACAPLLALLLYANALDNPFVYDDYALVVDNPTLGDLRNIAGLVLRNITRPLVNLSYALDTAVWGSAPFGYHLTSALLHALNVVLVFWTTKRACEDRLRQKDQVVRALAPPATAALAAAVLFAAHPMMTEAVGYITGRAELLCGSFFLMAFLAGRRWMLSGGRVWWMACAGLWLAAMLTKETAAVLPFALISYGWLVLDAPPAEKRRRLLGMGIPFVGLAVAAGLVRITVFRFVEYTGQGLDWRFALVSADAVWRYLALFLYPHDQALFHAMTMPEETAPLRMVAVIAGIIAVPLAVSSLRRSHSLMAFGIVWFVLLLMPAGALFALGIGEPMAERRTYLAAAGLFLWWGSSFAMLWERSAGRMAMRVGLAVLGVLFTLQLSLQTLVRNEIWGDPVMLMRESVALAPGHWIPWMLLGDALRRVDRCQDAIDAYRNVVEIRPKEESAYNKISGCLIKAHRFEEARAEIFHLQSLDPASQEAAVTLGVLAILEHDHARARPYLAKAVSEHPDSAEAAQLLAFVDGTLPADQRQAMCGYFHSMDERFDEPACAAQQPATSGGSADGR